MLERAAGLGLKTILVEEPSEMQSEWFGLASKTLLLPYKRSDDYIGCLAALHERDPLLAMISVNEIGLSAAAAASEALDLPHLSMEGIRCIRDKHLFRQALQGDLGVRAAAVSNPDDVVEFGEQNGWPLVLKPRQGTGSTGVRRIASSEDCVQLELADESGYLVEEFLFGRELSVESFSFGGRHLIVAINEETNGGGSIQNEFLEIAHQLPACLTEREVSAVHDVVIKMLDKVNISDGASHTEVILTHGGPRIVETHARIGGDHITDMIYALSGLDLVRLSVGWAAKKIAPLEVPPQMHGGAAIRYFTAAPGKVVSVGMSAPWRYYPGVIDLQLTATPGSVVGPTAKSSDRLGYVMAVGQNSSVAAETCKRVVEAIEIKTIPLS
nr:ATP-grasp domain-containing protein [Gluconacetobacter sacchari]